MPKDLITLPIRLPRDLYESLRRGAYETKTSMAQIVVRAVEKEIKMANSLKFHGKEFFEEARRAGWDGLAPLGWERGDTACSQCGAFFHVPVLQDGTTGHECQTCECK